MRLSEYLDGGGGGAKVTGSAKGQQNWVNSLNLGWDPKKPLPRNEGEHRSRTSKGSQPCFTSCQVSEIRFN